jgi:predicted nucleotidyltransferase
MLIGAHCRDLLHAAFGRTDQLRSTNDVDIALAVNGYEQYRQITSFLPRSGTTDIRYSIAGMNVDIVPFGEIEDPAGTAALPGRSESIDVFGFRECFDRSNELFLPSGHRIRLSSPQAMRH